VETIKQIAKELPNAIQIDDVTTETQDNTTPRQKGWHEIAQKVQVENDAQRIIKLVADLIAALDEEDRRKSGKVPSAGACALDPTAVSTPQNPSTVSQLGSEKAPDL
jgi:hypothetical protein